MPSVDLCCLRLCCRATVAWAGPEQQCGGRTAKQRLRERGFPLAAWAGPAPDRLAPSSAAGVRGIYAACKSLSVVSSVHHRVHVWRFSLCFKVTSVLMSYRLARNATLLCYLRSTSCCMERLLGGQRALKKCCAVYGGSGCWGRQRIIAV